MGYIFLRNLHRLLNVLLAHSVTIGGKQNLTNLKMCSFPKSRYL